MPPIFNISAYKYDGAGVMVNTEDKHDRVYADTDMWIKAKDVEKLNQEVEEDEQRQQTTKN